jgi:mRNA interferase RelE/StbE
LCSHAAVCAGAPLNRGRQTAAVACDLARDSGYTLARMRYEVVLAPDAARTYRALPATRRAEVRDALERHLRYGPTRVSKSRIKRLRGLSQPQYRIRVGEVRVFHDVTREAVDVLAIVTKAEAAGWLAAPGTPRTPGGAR